MKTYEEILQEMLDTVDDSIYKAEGSLIYNALAPAAAELAQMYIELDDLMNRTFADTATGSDLTKRAAERGINRIVATAAVRKGVFNLNVPVGSRFSLEDTTYIVTENFANFESKLLCEQTGTIGNTYSGEMLAVTYVAGLTTATLNDILILGEDEESDDDLRIRYFDDLESAAFGGNQADYKEKTKELAGIGGVKVYPAWNGGGTVKLVILDSTYAVPSGTLVNDTQTAIDPVANSGEGLGIAPIGHSVTVEAVAGLNVNITFTLTFVTGYVWTDVETYIREAINAYFLELKKTWEDESALVVRIAQIESAILQVTGVLDITGTTLNGGVTNLILTDVQIPVLGTVTNI
jgi:uncharacterized phage protein gp47/JayE